MSNVKLLSSEEALKRQMVRLEKRKCKRAATVSTTQSVVSTEGIDQPESVAPAIKKSRKRPRRERPPMKSQLFLRKDVKNLSKKVASLSSTNWKLKKEVKETKYKAEKALKDDSDKLAKAKKENAQLRASLKLSEEKLSQTDELFAYAMERLDKAADEAVI
ncbi:hypothetical protein Q3G72_029684 [Acer saccharum]|nr:hypothetical protein Q3G72_029684 [Acer saccharum]